MKEPKNFQNVLILGIMAGVKIGAGGDKNIGIYLS
jgi:hypothetical protein